MTTEVVVNGREKLPTTESVVSSTNQHYPQ